MSKNKTSFVFFAFSIALVAGLLLSGPAGVEAGIFQAGNEVTYKEYWVHHNQFTGGCNPDGTPTNPGGSFYLEPGRLNRCPKTVNFNLPDDFSNALKIELYLDLWRNYDTRSARFKINNGATIYAPPVGSDWSRTPIVMDIPKSEFKTGANTITFWGEKLYHVHDIGIRIYYNNANPLVAAPGGDVTPPDGQLTSIEHDGGVVNPNAGGTLTVNSEQLKLTADISPDTAYVEFHAWYEGYDEDNDGNFRDWHNLGRNNWWPGGREEKPTGGVINHIGTVKPATGATTASITWSLAHITNQPLIKFKIRVVDAAGNVREAAGGESANFKMMRAAPVNSFIIHDFKDFGIHMDGGRPDTVSYNFTMPPTVTSYFTQAYLVGAYWRNPQFIINTGSSSSANTDDMWKLGIRSFNKNTLLPGLNKITYNYSGSGSGHFIEEPGPMFVLRRSNAAADNTNPAVSKLNPQPNATNVNVNAPVVAHIGDGEFGVDWTTVSLTINGVDVTNKARLQGTMGDYRLVYAPQGGLDFDTEYNVKIEACDMAGNCMAPFTYKFNTPAPDTTPPNISNIVVEPLPNGANVSWKTNEPATSRVDYGVTKNYELGFVEDLALKTDHLLQIRGLQPLTDYNLRIRAGDAQSNVGESGNQAFKTLEFGLLLSDDFNACLLDESLWTVTDPKGDLTWFMNGEEIEMTIPAGSSHDWTTGGPPRLMQDAANGDFSVEVKFNSVTSQAGQMQGILIEQDANNYVRVGYEYSATKGPIMFVRFVQNGTPVKDATREFATLTPPLTTTPSYMRVTRTGVTWQWYWSTDGVKWTRGNLPYDISMTVMKTGFFAGNSGAQGAQPGHKAVVDYFFNSDLPISPEDATPMTVNVSVVGNGTVTKLPDKPAYICGEEVILDATTVPGWSFSEWGGDATGASPSVAVTVDEPKEITATFTEDQYLLTISIENLGTGGDGNKVEVKPLQATYRYGDVVELKAVPIANWFFVGWSGSGISGSENPLMLTMQSDVSITATFSSNPPPVIDPIPNKTTLIGALLTFQVKASDPLGESLTITYDSLPPGATFVDNGNGTGTFTWRPGMSQAGEHVVTFTVSDGTNQVTQSVTITVGGTAIALPVIVRP